MGRPKALLPYRSSTFLGHLLEVVRHPRIEFVRVVLGAHADLIAREAKLDPAAVVVNEDWENGQLSSIQAAIRSLPRDATEGLLLCLVDQPLITAELVAQLIEQFDASGKSVTLPVHRAKRGHPVIFRSTLYEELLSAPLELGARAVVWNHPDEILAVATEEEGVLLNLNDPETLRRALADVVKP